MLRLAELNNNVRNAPCHKGISFCAKHRVVYCERRRREWRKFGPIEAIFGEPLLKIEPMELISLRFLRNLLSFLWYLETAYEFIILRYYPVTEGFIFARTQGSILGAPKARAEKIWTN